MCTVERRRKSESGFSLIELAIVMIVIGLLAVPLMQLYSKYLIDKKRTDTNLSFSEVSRAMSDFYDDHGRYPCPSDRSIAFGAPNHGRERCTQVNALGPNACSAGNGLCRTQSAGGAFIQIGGIPYASLGMPYADTMDGWRKNMKYAVTSALSDPRIEDTTLVPRIEFNPNAGAIQIVNEFGVPVAGLFHSVIVSLGDNGNGAFNVYGRQQPCDITLVEGENCDEDGVFVNGLLSLGANNRYNDDYIRPSSWTASSIWGYTDDETSVKSENPGNVGVGTKTPTTKLDVVGDLKADAIRSTSICNTNGTDCFPAETIGGTGIQCPVGKVLTGIANNAPVCANIPVNVTGSCAAGTFVTAIVNGVVQCGTP